jgi:hypothetical protein
VSRKTTTTTVVHSEKDKEGNWSEFSKTVTTVVERDDDGYPYGPLVNTYLGSQYAKNRYGSRSGLLGDYIAWYDSLSARPAKTDEEDGTNG